MLNLALDKWLWKHRWKIIKILLKKILCDSIICNAIIKCLYNLSHCSEWISRTIKVALISKNRMHSGFIYRHLRWHHAGSFTTAFRIFVNYYFDLCLHEKLAKITFHLKSILFPPPPSHLMMQKQDGDVFFVCNFSGKFSHKMLLNLFKIDENITNSCTRSLQLLRVSP